jgi:hypothetical protein
MKAALRAWAVALLFAATSAAAQAAPPYVRLHTSAFWIQVPGDWSVRVVRASEDGRRGYWIFQDPTGDSRLHLRIGRLREEKIAALWYAYVSRLLGRFLRKIHVQSVQATQTSGGREVALGFVYGVGRRIRTQARRAIRKAGAAAAKRTFGKARTLATQGADAAERAATGAIRSGARALERKARATTGSRFKKAAPARRRRR